MSVDCDCPVDTGSLHDIVELFHQDSDEPGEEATVQRSNNRAIHSAGFEYCEQFERDGVRVKVVDSQPEKAVTV